MSVGAWGRTWEDASTPSAARLTRRYEQAWREAEASGTRPDPRLFLANWPDQGGFPGARLALLRADMSLRWESGQRASAEYYEVNFPELGEDTIVALIYEEFCLLEEAGEAPRPEAFLARYTSHAEPLRRVLDIHQLVGAASTSNLPGSETLEAEDASPRPKFPEAGDVIGGFLLVEELGRGSFARVFLARETQLADRPVALKVSLRGSREPQTLARLQHTHIVPVYSHRVDPSTGLHILCMPYFGRVTLARLLSEVDRAGDDEPLCGDALIAALERLEPAAGTSAGTSATHRELADRPFARALAWWGARLAEALGHAHDRGVLHRDVKPSNVLIAADGTPMLLDFNLAHEAIVDDDPSAPGAGLGGTVDYMAPEHLEALAEAQGDHVDARADVFSLGVLLYEALLGRKPFDPPRRSASIGASLLAAADDRRRDPRALFSADAGLPAPLRSVLLRCLAAEPDDRYQTAEDLAADLQAVADDLPLIVAHEPFWSRAMRRIRRNRFRFATAALILLCCAVAGGAAINLGIERADRAAQAQQRLERGDDRMQARGFDDAIVQYEAALQFAEGSEQPGFGRFLAWGGLRGLGERIRMRLSEPDAYSDLERQVEEAHRKIRLAVRSSRKRKDAEDLHAASEGLRMRFVGVAAGRAEAAEELKRLLKPFYVLGPHDWTSLEHNLDMLDADELSRLKAEVDELLFLWLVCVESTMGDGSADGDPTATLDDAVSICDKALRFVESPGPWRALRARFEDRRSGSIAASSPLLDEPRIADEKSALSCFQWGLLYASRQQPAPAILWLQRAVRIDWSNYWYQFFLGYLEDQAGLEDDALDQYNVAAAVRKDSPWVLFSQARLYHKQEQWSWAVDGLTRALALMGDRPEASRVRLDLGYVYQSLGDFTRAREAYSEVVRTDRDGPLGRAARLNLANIDADSGDVDRAREAFADLLATDPGDAAARRSRALLDLRTGRPEFAASALDQLLEGESRPRRRAELLTERAIGRMLLGRGDDAVADAREALRLDPTPGRDRLLERTLLAAGRYRELQIDRPEELRALPVGGSRLVADLAFAERRIAEEVRANPEPVYRLLLTRAVILSALGRHAEAARSVRASLAAANDNSPDAHLVAGRIARAAGDPVRAAREVERGLKLDSDDAGLLELRGVLRLESGDPGGALADLDLAVARSDGPQARARQAEALHHLGEFHQSILEWTSAIRRDGERPDLHLGRALAYLALPSPLWDAAIVDLERAAARSLDDPATDFKVLAAYAGCLPERPNRLPRWLALGRRSVERLWGRLQPWSFLIVGA